MPKGLLEHVNISVSDNRRMAALLAEMCGWKVRWEGPAAGGGHTIHIGSESNYIALYTAPRVIGGFVKGLPLNHVALEVDDLDGAEAVVEKAGLVPFNHADYDPGRRFYFFDWDGIEWEVVCYY
ncbi:VOC family protein [Pseudoblastomonas halimionae]|uniref:VOC family protein n=1 Tax=Alteriqipengyuania halimionae TaxID=1926630 RepID=A0A6I4U708_9SPHN|nr:VOC family protein [Alteriqipengyuania halimionae]MXP10077.1 VOC family protein [Alteriqipengyuania halimionae]